RALLALALEVRDLLVDRVLVRVDVGDEVPDPTLEVELSALAAGPLVGEDDPQPASQERRLAQALAERLVRPVAVLEDLLDVGEEGDRRAGVGRLAGHLELPGRLSAREGLLVDL